MNVRAWQAMRAAGMAALLVLSLAPCLAPVALAFVRGESLGVALEPRTVTLLARSVDIALVVGLLTAAVASAAVLWASAISRRGAGALFAASCIALFFPPVSHASAWSWAVGEMGARGPATGIVGTVLAQAGAFLPVATGVVALWVGAVTADAVDAARVLGSDRSAIARVIVPAAAPGVMAAGVIVSLLSLGDYSVPSAFGVDTYSMELFAEYAASGPARALALSWPLTALALAGAVGVAAPLASAASAAGRAQRAGGRAWRVPARTGVADGAVLWGGAALASAAAAFVALAALRLLPAPAEAWAAVTDAAPDVGLTLGAALAAAAVAFPVALAAGSPRAPGAGPSPALFALAVGAVVVPPPVVGAGLIALWNHSVAAWLFESPAAVVLASLARFVPLAVAVTAVSAARLDRSALEAALVHASPRRAWAAVLAPSLAPSALAGSLVVAALATGELGATLMVLPPGSSTATARAYNLLHFGALGDVAAIGLLVAACGTVLAGGTALILRRWAR